MRFLKYVASLAAFAFLLSGAALAKDMNSGKFDLQQQARIGQTILNPGSYKAEWTGPDNALQVSIMQGNKTVATASGMITELPHPAPYDAVTVKTKSDRIEQIEFNHRKEALTISGS
jgi:hypothetical protein